MANAGVEQYLKYQEPYLKNGLPNETGSLIFVPLSYLESSDPVKAYKEYTDNNGGLLEEGEVVTVRVTIKANQSFRGTFGDRISGPRTIKTNMDGTPASLTIPPSYTHAKILPPDGDFSYLINNIVLNAGATFSYTYTLIYQGTPAQKISLADIDGTDYKLTTPRKDTYLDIKSQPTDGCIKYMNVWVNDNKTNEKKRSYTMTGINLQALIDETTDSNTEEEDLNSIINDALNGGAANFDIPGISDNGLNLKSILSDARNPNNGFSLNLNLNIFDE